MKRNRLSSFELPPKSDTTYLYYTYYFKDLKEIFDSYIRKGNRVLDIGCGNKPFENYIRGLTEEESKDSYIGCDLEQSSEEKVDILCDATNIPLSTAFDVVICTQLIEHVFDHQKVFEEAYRILNPGGFFIVSSNFLWETHEAPYDFYRFTRFAFQKLLEKTGFEVIEGRANGGKWATIGQFLSIAGHIAHRPTDPLLLRALRTAFRKTFHWTCNSLFFYLDKKHYNPDRYTMNYIFVGKKQK
ncbi:class I SAM-dependent methyltransferase [Parabacteroides sp. OttesenSCG-928-O15]|nr:class I SAM-dependent methyltransferase [Parabacteroides sp. OttesenSCG-928-O15]